MGTEAVCFVGATALPAEIANASEDSSVPQPEGAHRVVLNLDRRCGRWTRWKEFRTPNEHYEDEVQVRLAQDRRAFEAGLHAESQKTQRTMGWLASAQVATAALGIGASYWIARDAHAPTVPVVSSSPSSNSWLRSLILMPRRADCTASSPSQGCRTSEPLRGRERWTCIVSWKFGSRRSARRSGNGSIPLTPSRTKRSPSDYGACEAGCRGCRGFLTAPQDAPCDSLSPPPPALLQRWAPPQA